MNDENYWKERYKEFWDVSADKEEKIKNIIEGESNCTCEYTGLGAGSTEYLSGSALSRGFRRGGSDFRVKDTDIFIEVTGPNVASVGRDAPLWIRPDKIQNAIDNPENDYWVVHVLKRDFHIRTIHIDDEFKRAYINGVFELVSPIIRGAKEKYISVEANSEYISTMENLFETINQALGNF